MDRTALGRAGLRAWEAARPGNFYDDEPYLGFLLERWMGRARLLNLEPALRQAGADAAGPIERAAAELDRPENLPRLDAWSRIGEPRADIRFHPLHDAVGRLVWRSGILAVLAEPGHVLPHLALAYLFGQQGEVPHLCSVACTAGLVKVIQRAGDARMRQQWLPRLLDPDYDRRWHGAQFVTEVQGGSDVGANACTARQADGGWRLTGEKWFCSNVSADLWVVSARPEGAPAGTAGIGLFVVPRCLEDGRPNGVVVRRLKDKLGTRTLPTAEVELRDALAWPVGRPAEGFRLLMGLVINTSRLHVAAGTSALMRRAFVEAWHYAGAREAFGETLRQLPGVRRQLAEMRVLGAAGLALTLFAAAREDELARAGAPVEEDPLYRTAVNVAKHACSSDAGLVVHHALEVLGGNGTIETFSPVPRLYREVPVQESWEGPHNTLVAQVLRDGIRGKLHHALLRDAEERLLALPARGPTAAAREGALAALETLRGRLDGLLRGDPAAAGYHLRPAVGRLARLVQVTLLLEDACVAGERPGLGWLPAAADWLLHRDLVPGYDPADDPGYPARIGQILEG
jgi:alkylation response protein AidB-like acyl-CoA dehydrogenase